MPVDREPAPSDSSLQARRRLGVVAALVVLSLTGGSFATAGAPEAGARAQLESNDADRAEVRYLINLSRNQNGLRSLSPNPILDLKADMWAQNLRNICALKHSQLADGAPPGWRKLGENVGRGGTIPQIHEAYLNSPSHRKNILDPVFTQVGTGAVWGNCGGFRTVFTVQEFMK
ncbi:MAG: CAP domain-containing protein [Actinobacteria bacterium]|nr:CAP domain-containing protein [Actinomycetota bacterium]